VAVKLIMTWDILPGREQAYFEFVVQDFIPALQRLGLQPSEAWFTVYGEGPQITTVALAPSLNMLRSVLHSTAWRDLESRLLGYVTNYRYKIVRARPGFQF